MTPIANRESSARDEPPLSAKVAFLSDAGNHSRTAGTVTVLETHFAFLFLVDALAYKLKKPQRYPLVDLSSPESRRLACEEEIRLNAGLGPGVYQGLSRLTADDGGSLSLDGDGRPVDYLVRMRRLDEADCLRHQLSGTGPDAQEVDRAARRLIRHYQAGTRQRAWGMETYRRQWQRLHTELDTLLDQPALAGTLHDRLLAWLGDHAALLESRWTVDAHGDLRPEHIYLGPEPVFIDRLEFNPTLRMMDPVEELAFLTMECDRLGGRWVGERFLARYREITGDTGFDGLPWFYEASRALLWAVLSARHLATGTGDPATWRHRAETYLQHGLRCLEAA